MMTFTYTHSSKPQQKITLEIGEDSNIEDVLRMFRAFLLGVGYTAETVKEWLGES